MLGEVHDNALHHINQARIVEALNPAALVFEMIEPADALEVTPEMRGNSVLLEETLQWNSRGWPDFSMYYPILSAAPEAAIFGASLPRETVRQAVSKGAASVFGDAASLFGVDNDLPPDQLEQRIKLQQEAHCGALPEDLLPGMVEAQRLRDAALAKATIAAWAQAEDGAAGPVVVITGNGHAREDWGVPAMLRRYFAEDPDIDIRSLGQFEVEAPSDAAYTLTTETPAAEREDPCAAFAK